MMEDEDEMITRLEARYYRDEAGEWTADFLPDPAPEAGEVADCWRCAGKGCGHCASTGKLRWLGCGISEPWAAG